MHHKKRFSDFIEENEKDTLFNFRCSSIILGRFTEVAELLGKPKSQILRELMDDFVFDFWSSEENISELRRKKIDDERRKAIDRLKTDFKTRNNFLNDNDLDPPDNKYDELFHDSNKVGTW